MESHICQRCGAAVTKRGATYVCAYCRATYEDDAEERATVTLQGLLDGIKIERLSAARKKLYDAAHAQYPSKDVVIDAANAVLAIYPDDALAKVYLYSHEEPAYRLAELLPSLKLTKPEADDVLSWVTRSLTAELVGPIHDFAERHYRDQELTAAMTRIEEEANKLFEGVYIPSLPRDVFLAYSSADMPQVIHILNLLEENGFTAFAAFRNLRHGKGAAGDYWSSLKEAMEACACFVYISSKHSRAATCDALKREIPHLTVHLPKKPRIEFLLEDYDDRTPFLVKNTLKKAFPDQEYCRDEEDLLLRIQSILEGAPSPEEPAPAAQAAASPAAAQQAPAAPVIEEDEDRPEETPRDHFEIEGDVLKRYRGKDETVVIPAGIKIIAKDAFVNFSGSPVKRIYIPNGVTRIEEMAFYHCDQLKEVRFPPTLEFMGKLAFGYCRRLTEVVLPGLIREISAEAFRECTQVKTVKCAAKRIGERAFRECASLRTVDLGEGTKIIEESVFNHCGQLASLHLPDSLQEIGNGAFARCEFALSEVRLPKSLKTLGQDCFSFCNALKRIEIPGSVETIESGAFSCCDSLEDVVIHEGTTFIGQVAFGSCRSLKHVTLPSTVTSIGPNAFNGNRATITCPNEKIKATVQQSVKHWDHHFTLVVG